MTFVHESYATCVIVCIFEWVCAIGVNCLIERRDIDLLKLYVPFRKVLNIVLT